MRIEMTDEDNTPMTVEMAVAALQAIGGGDPEGAHAEADLIVLRAVDPAVAEAYEKLVERAGAWWYA